MPAFFLPVAEEVVKESGSRTSFPTIVHTNYEAFSKAAESIQHDYNQAMNTDIDVKTVTEIPGLGSIHPIALTIPNCLPERIAAVTRFAEFTILNDDFYDLANKEEIQNVNDDIQSLLGRQASAGDNAMSTASSTQTTKSKLFQASLFLDLMNIDQELALNIMNSYSEGLELATFAPDQVKTLDEYLPLRKINSGLDVTSHMVCFAMGFKLSDREREMVREITDSAMYALTVINDLYSWPKEIKAHLQTPGSERPFNAVAILMRHSGRSETEAFEMLREMQSQLEARHLHLIAELKARLHSEGSGLSENQELYLQTAQAAASGSELWSIYTQRYPSKEDLAQSEVEFADNEFRYKAEPSNEVDAAVVEAQEQFNALHFDVKPLEAGQRPVTPPASDPKSDSSSFTTCTSPKSPTANDEKVDGHTAHAEKVTRAPSSYVSSLPSKGIRDIFLDSLNVWLEVPEASMQSIKKVISRLHDSSLMLDDIEDDSTLRRGNPAAHVVYGTAQTINSANYLMIMALEELRTLNHKEKTLSIFTEELRSLFLGQGLDLHWKYHVELPSVEQYMEMIDNKTGGLFRLCVRLMQAESTRSELLHLDSSYFVRQLSLYFQIRDDYLNLVSDQYAKQKGFAEDLDEGKISLPLLYALESPNCPRYEILGIFRHKQPGPMPLEVKQYLIAQIKKSGALDTIYSELKVMQEKMLAELKRLEVEFGSKNPTLELVLRKLWIM